MNEWKFEKYEENVKPEQKSFALEISQYVTLAKIMFSMKLKTVWFSQTPYAAYPETLIKQISS